MNTTEDRLRDALRGVGDTLGPADVPSLDLRPRRSPARRWAVPLAAAAALAAAVGTVTATLGGEQARQNPKPPTLAVKATGPKFYVSSGGDYDDPKVRVHEAATGKALYTLPPAPSGLSYGPVAAAGDDRTFFVAARSARSCTNRFLRFRVGDDGRPGRPTAIPGPAVKGVVMTGSLAATGDGSRLAYGLGGCSEVGKVYPKIGVVQVATGKQRTWSSERVAQAVSLSWAADGRTLGFLLMVGTGVPAGSDFTQDVQVRALDTNTPGGDIFKARTLLTQSARLGKINEAVLGPDGRTIYAWLQPAEWGVRPPNHEGLIMFVDGKPVRVVLARPKDDDGWGTVKIDSSGRHLLVERSSFLARIDDGKYRELPRIWREGSEFAW